VSIRVSDIMKLQSLNNIELIGGESGLENSVEWIYIAECFSDPLESVEWIQGGELIFITGLSLKGDMELLVEFIKGISAKKGAGLIINVGPYIDKVPQNAIDIANALGLPLFELPWKNKLIEVSQDVSKAIIMSRIEENSLSHFLSNILFGDGMLSGNIVEKAAYFGYNFDGECYICVIDIDKFGQFLKLNNLNDEFSISKLKINFRKIVQDILEKHGLKVPVIDKDDAVIIFNKSDEHFISRFERAVKEIQETMKKNIKGLTVSIGIGNSYKDLNMMKQSLKEAEIAIDSAKCKGLDDTITKYKDIGIHQLLFSIENKELLKGYYLNLLGPILESENKFKDVSSIKILETYLNENCNITLTAEKLFLHRNTLKYRINKIEELVNCDLHNFDHCMKMRIALYIKGMLS